MEANATPAQVTFAGVAGDWTVLLDGVAIGRVRYHEQGYNLVRYIVDREWRAYPSVDGRGDYANYNTRAEAAAWLVARSGATS